MNDDMDEAMGIGIYNRILEYSIGYWNYTVGERSMFILSRRRQIYNDMRLDYQQVIQ